MGQGKKGNFQPLFNLAALLVLAIPIALGFYYLSQNDLQPGYNPPAARNLIGASGSFLPQKYQGCDHSTGCAPLRFRADTGQVIDVNCEPKPALNRCLFSDQGFGDNGAYEGKPVILMFYNAGDSAEPHNVFLSLSDGNGSIMSYSDRVADIRNTRVSNGSRRSPGWFRYPFSEGAGRQLYLGGLAVWGLALFYCIVSILGSLTKPKRNQKSL